MRNRNIACPVARRIDARMQHQMTGLTDVEGEAPLPGYEWGSSVNREETGQFSTDVALTKSHHAARHQRRAPISASRPNDSREEVERYVRVRLPKSDGWITGLGNTRTADTQRPPAPGLANFVERGFRPQVDQLSARRDGVPSVFVKADVEHEVLANDKIADSPRG